MKKKLVVLSGIFYPFAMLHYFVNALERRKDVELITTGPFTGNWIPWNGGMEVDRKYVYIPTFPMGKNFISWVGGCSPAVAEQQIKDKYGKTPDLWMQVDAGFWFTRPTAKKVVHIATDPHCLNYDEQRSHCDIFFNMQNYYMKPGDKYLPYAVDPSLHFPLPNEPKLTDGCLIGLMYPQRLQLLDALRSAGYNIYSSTGEIFDVYNMRYNQSKVALNISSLLDVNARTFEAMGQKVPLITNRIPSLSCHFEENTHYLGFDTVSEALEKMAFAMNNPYEMEAMASRAYNLVRTHHTYDRRIAQIFEESGVK